MAAQYDLYRLNSGQYIVVLQSDLLDDLHTRVVAPLMPATGRGLGTLTPTFDLPEGAFRLMPQLTATLHRSELDRRVGSLALYRDEITRAVDALMSGI